MKILRLSLALGGSLLSALHLEQLTVPGEYRLYCSLHPTLMSQSIRVRPAAG